VSDCNQPAHAQRLFVCHCRRVASSSAIQNPKEALERELNWRSCIGVEESTVPTMICAAFTLALTATATAITTATTSASCALLGATRAAAIAA
jgi:hypothetical protein